MSRTRDDGDLTRYYDEVDRLKAEKLRRKALARERRGTLARFVEGAFIWTSIVLTLPLWLVVGGVVWILGRDPLYKTIRYHYGNDFTASAIMVAIVSWVIATGTRPRRSVSDTPGTLPAFRWTSTSSRPTLTNYDRSRINDQATD